MFTRKGNCGRDRSTVRVCGKWLALFAGVLCGLPHAAAADPAPENPFPNRPKAPSLEGGTGWLNTSGPIAMQDLRGKVVLLDFWTYCCINCMHVLPDLEYLEKKYADELVVIGVHSAKFDNEKESENIRRAILRYEIEHPVINDSKMTVWRKFGARAWPTMVLIDPEGHYCGHISGEGNREVLDIVIGKVIKFHRFKGTLDETPIHFDLERHSQQPTPLRFPGKVLADEAGGRLFISDSNHNRIVISTLDGKLIDIVGTGEIGADNGDFDEASFDHPQGMELVGDRLYVADTENHLIRFVDLTKKTVGVLAGTGEQARRRVSQGRLRTTALNSPWALLHSDGILYIAMAGPHQIWRHTLGAETVQVYAGSGREDILNGPLAEAALAQPSGLTTDGTFLYVADSEGSAIRRVSLNPGGQVTTVAGASDLPLGRSLFSFGDKDGTGSEARLQHPLGVAYLDNTIYVADAYNHKIKKVTLSKDDLGKTFGRAETWLGDGTAGKSLDPPRFSEPAGVTIAAGKLYIADTNNHRICVADVQSGKVSELTIAGLKPPAAKPDDGGVASEKTKASPVKAQTVASGDALRFEVALKLPKDYKPNTLYPIRYSLDAEKDQPLIADDRLGQRAKASLNQSTAVITVPLAEQTGAATLDLTLTFGYCREGTGGLCKIKTVRWRVPVQVKPDAKQTAVRLEATAD